MPPRSGSMSLLQNQVSIGNEFTFYLVLAVVSNNRYEKSNVISVYCKKKLLYLNFSNVWQGIVNTTYSNCFYNY